MVQYPFVEYSDCLGGGADVGVIRLNTFCHLSVWFLAVSAEKFEVEADFEVSLELRTAYMQGVILTTSHQRGKRALALEIHEGQVTCSFYQRVFRFH